MKLRLFALLLAAVCAVTLRADEIRLKNGSKITGTIVGFENGSFKVETAYGFALIRKDAVADIVPADSHKTISPPAAPKPAEESRISAKSPVSSPATSQIPIAPKPATISAVSQPTSQPISHPVPQTVSDATSERAPTAARNAPLPPAHQPSGTSPAKPGSPSPIASSPVYADAAASPVQRTELIAPAHITEFVRGNLYTNQTYGFEMYKPPDWDLIHDAGKALPNAIAALGTRDETSLMVVGHDPLGDSLDAHADTTEHTLREIYQNYRPVSLRRTIVAGCPAIEDRFRGDLDGHNWSAVIVTLVRGKEAFTILAMSYADSDLIQLQDNVIARMISSLHFNASVN